MISATGAKLITVAALFGAAAAIFTMVPFGIAIVRGIMKSRNSTTGGGDILTAVLLAFFVHLLASLSFMGLVKILDALDPVDNTYLQNKVFPIFWAGDNKANVIALAGGGSGTHIDAAYSVLHAVFIVIRNVYIAMPVLLIFFAMSYGLYLANKDVYRQDRTTVMIYVITSVLVTMTLFVAWQGIATPALFLPGGLSLNQMIMQQWQLLLGV